MLIDRTVVTLKGGRGGNGSESYEYRGPRKFYPYGGNGGKGGDIIVMADTNMRSLECYKYERRFNADNGGPGGPNRRSGKCAKSRTLRVPMGTRITTSDEQFVIRDLIKHGDEVIVVKGGAGGYGNQDNQTVSPGREGEERDVVFDYRMVSDVALIGLPNSGKSSVLAALTRARVKIAEHPFSTLVPQLGSCEFKDYSRCLLCDIPSLMEGSHEEKGVGNRFLKHIERAVINCFVVEPQSEFAASPHEAIDILMSELDHYDVRYSMKPSIVLLNKCDLCTPAEIKKYKDQLKKKHKYVYNISTQNKKGFSSALLQLKKMLVNIRKEQVENALQ